jgi:hypothetical protein
VGAAEGGDRVGEGHTRSSAFVGRGAVVLSSRSLRRSATKVNGANDGGQARRRVGVLSRVGEGELGKQRPRTKGTSHNHATTKLFVTRCVPHVNNHSSTRRCPAAARREHVATRRQV